MWPFSSNRQGDSLVCTFRGSRRPTGRVSPAKAGLRARRCTMEALEQRTLLSVVGWDENDGALPAAAAQFVPGEILVGFEGDVVAAYHGKGAAAALEAAGKLVGANGLHSPEVLMDTPAAANHGSRLATHWRLPAGADVLGLDLGQVARRIGPLRVCAHLVEATLQGNLRGSGPGSTRRRA